MFIKILFWMYLFLIIDAEIGDEGIISFSENMKYLPNLTKLRLNSINDIIRK